MSYDPKGTVAKVFEPLLANELASTYGITDDAQDTAEYINDRIGQGKSAAEICLDVKDVINIPIDEAFMGRVFAEITRLQQLEASGQPLTPQQQQQQQQQQPQHQEQAPQEVAQPQMTQSPFPAAAPVVPATSAAAAPAINPFFPNGAPAPTFSTPVGGESQQNQKPKVFPSGPAMKGNSQKKGHVDFHKVGAEPRKTGIQKGKPTRGGVGKDYDSKTNQRATQRKGINAANLQRTLNAGSDATVNMQTFTQRPPKGRCKEFPHCSNIACEFSHPTRNCFKYPDCPNPPGTCDYLHPSEDQKLIQELAKTKTAFRDRRAQAAVTVDLCKFGVLCSKELCPFGHPTPANKHAKVMVPKWCSQPRDCSDPECQFAHSSPNYQAEPVRSTPAPRPGAKGGRLARVATTLEQCKFGKGCTNSSCPKRHATSMVACHGGYTCTRMDCTFAHPILEPCRFGEECKSKTCFYIHPDAREHRLFFRGDGLENTSGRTFAVPEDQVMEQAVQQ